MNQITIYALKDPRTEAIRYIGKTKDLDLRQRQHSYSYTNRRFARWYTELLSLGLQPIFVTLESDVPADQGDNREWHWITWAHNSGCDLLNKQGMSRLRNN